MGMTEMTDQEKALLDLAYTDGERILSGQLYDYQEDALKELRECTRHLMEKYQGEELEVISFTPSTKKGCASLQFVQKGFYPEYTLKYEKGVYSDNFYDVPFEKEYDAMVEELLRQNGIEAKVYTVFPYLIADKIKSAQDLMDRRPHLGRNTEIFIDVDEALPECEESDALSEKIQGIFEEAGIYTSGMIFWMLDLDQMQEKTVIELDEYVRDRKNLRRVVSSAFRCFHVK